MQVSYVYDVYILRDVTGTLYGTERDRDLSRALGKAYEAGLSP